MPVVSLLIELVLEPLHYVLSSEDVGAVWSELLPWRRIAAGAFIGARTRGLTKKKRWISFGVA